MKILSAAALFKFVFVPVMLLCIIPAGWAQSTKQSSVSAFSSQFVTPSHSFSGCTPGVSSDVICRGFALKDFYFYGQLEVVNTQGQTGKAGMGWGAATSFVIRPEKVSWLRFSNSYYYYANSTAMQNKQLSAVTITENCKGRQANIRFAGKLKIYYNYKYAGEVNFQVTNGLDGMYVFPQGKTFALSLNLDAEDMNEAASRLYNFSYKFEVTDYEGHCECCDEIARAVAGGNGHVDNAVPDPAVEKKKNVTVVQKQLPDRSSAVKFANPYDLTVTHPAYPDAGNGETDFDAALKAYTGKVGKLIPLTLDLPMNNQCAYEMYANTNVIFALAGKSKVSYQNYYQDCMADPKQTPWVSVRYDFELKDVESVCLVSQKGATVSLCGLMFKARDNKNLFKCTKTDNGEKTVSDVSVFIVFLSRDLGQGCGTDIENNDLYTTVNQLRIIACNTHKAIQASYSAQTVAAYRAKSKDTAKRTIRFTNGSLAKVEVRLYHPDNPNQVFQSYTFKSGESAYLGSPRLSISGDWGIQVVASWIDPLIYPVGELSYLQDGAYRCNSVFFEDHMAWPAATIEEYGVMAADIDNYKATGNVANGYLLFRNDLDNDILLEIFNERNPFNAYHAYVIKPFVTQTIDSKSSQDVMNGAWALRASFTRSGSIPSRFFVIGNLATVNNGSFFINASSVLKDVQPTSSKGIVQTQQTEQHYINFENIYTDTVRVYLYSSMQAATPFKSWLFQPKQQAYLTTDKKIKVDSNWGIMVQSNGVNTQRFAVADVCYINNDTFKTHYGILKYNKTWPTQRINQVSAIIKKMTDYRAAHDMQPGFIAVKNDMAVKIELDVFHPNDAAKVYAYWSLMPGEVMLLSYKSSFLSVSGDWAIRANYTDKDRLLSNVLLVGNVATFNNGQYQVDVSKLLAE